MTTNLHVSPFLRVQRHFPTDNPQALAVEMDRSYVDIASKVNNRVVGIYPLNYSVSNGEQWFLNDAVSGGDKFSGQRIVFQITSYSAFNHGLNFESIFSFTTISATGFDGTNYFPIPYVDPTAANSVGIYVSPTQVNFIAGGGAPAIISGIVLLEWISRTKPS